MNHAQHAAATNNDTELSEERASQFEALVAPYRREIRLHCYRMLGSFDEAEDMTQESMLRAWRNFSTFDDRGYARAWLYRISTNACLNALASRKMRGRWLPNEAAPATTSMPDGKALAEMSWLEPYPTPHLDQIPDASPDQFARYTETQSVRLAFVAAIQHLPPRQRAALLVCDVLGWSAMEASTLFGGSVASINSALQRARETLAKKYPDGTEKTGGRVSSNEQRLLDRYVEAWQKLDLSDFVSLLREDAIYTMPPLSEWYAGTRDIERFFRWAWKGYDSYRLLPISANGGPAFAAYSRNQTGIPWSAHSIQLLETDGENISNLTLFLARKDTRLFKAFGLPLSLEVEISL